MSDVLNAEQVQDLLDDLAGEVSDDRRRYAYETLLGQFDDLRARVVAAERERDEAAETQSWPYEEIARLREFGEHYSGAAQDAWDRIEVLEKALRRAYPYVMDALRHAEENTPATAYIVLEDLEQFIVPALAAAPVSTETT